MRPPSALRPVLASALAYGVIAALIGRHVLASAATAVASDPGDPLLTTAILAWNARHVPWTEAWYQFPVFYPTPSVLAMSEHLLGASVIATPLQWLTGSPLIAYNLTVLFSYPLCGAAMYALVWRLTRSSAAAFLAGLAYAFSPYRVSQLPHIQMLLSFWMPVALLGLHGYLETRRARWLALFGVSWLLQGASNGYYLIYFTLFVGLWMAWFMAARGRWRDTFAVAATMAVAIVPLAPVLYRYLSVQQSLDLSRSIGEVAVFSADIAGVLCAPPRLTVWGWLRIACGPEAELFAGVALVTLCAAGYAANRARMRREGSSRITQPRREGAIQRIAFHVATALTLLFLLVTLWTLVTGPWRIELSWLRASASSADKPASLTLFFLFVALLTSRWLHDLVRRGSTTTFYLLAAVVCWVLALGPFPRLFGEPVLYQAPYAWLLQIPGVSGVRAPARLWMLAGLSLAAFMGLMLPALLERRRAMTGRLIVLLAAIGLSADGWTTIRAAEVPAAGPAHELAGQTVLSLPLGEPFGDIAAVYRAVTGGHHAVNGYSGYEPPHYEALRTLVAAQDDRALTPFTSRGDLHLLVGVADAASQSWIERQAGQVLVSTGALAHYRIAASNTREPAFPASGRLQIEAITATCSAQQASLAVDARLDTKWACGGLSPEQALTADLRVVSNVGAIVHAMGTAGAEFPRNLVVETSLDGAAWMPAWQGSPAAEVLVAALAAPRESRAIITFPSRSARYVRLRQTVRDDRYVWSIAELEIRSNEPAR